MTLNAKEQWSRKRQEGVVFQVKMGAGRDRQSPPEKREHLRKDPKEVREPATQSYGWKWKGALGRRKSKCKKVWDESHLDCFQKEQGWKCRKQRRKWGGRGWSQKVMEGEITHLLSGQRKESERDGETPSTAGVKTTAAWTKATENK